MTVSNTQTKHVFAYRGKKKEDWGSHPGMCLEPLHSLSRVYLFKTRKIFEIDIMGKVFWPRVETYWSSNLFFA